MILAKQDCRSLVIGIIVAFMVVMQTPFDPALYMRAPVFSVSEGIALARALQAACPRGMPALVKKAVERLQKRIDAAQQALLERQRAETQLSEEDNRALDREMDGAWSGLRMRLDGYAALPAAEYPRARRAGELSAMLFGSDGLVFLRDSYPVQWTTMETLLARIDKDKLESDIDTLCGPEFLSHIRLLLPRYQRMVETIARREQGLSHNLAEHRQALARAIVSYATAMCATVDDEDAESIERVMTALRPLDNHRTTAARRGQGSSTRTSPEEPVIPAEQPALSEPAVISEPADE